MSNNMIWNLSLPSLFPPLSPCYYIGWGFSFMPRGEFKVFYKTQCSYSLLCFINESIGTMQHENKAGGAFCLFLGCRELCQQHTFHAPHCTRYGDAAAASPVLLSSLIVSFNLIFFFSFNYLTVILASRIRTRGRNNPFCKDFACSLSRILSHFHTFTPSVWPSHNHVTIMWRNGIAIWNIKCAFILDKQNMKWINLAVAAFMCCEDALQEFISGQWGTSICLYMCVCVCVKGQ